jgi:hypothetical protein
VVISECCLATLMVAGCENSNGFVQYAERYLSSYILHVDEAFHTTGDGDAPWDDAFLRAYDTFLMHPMRSVSSIDSGRSGWFDMESFLGMVRHAVFRDVYPKGRDVFNISDLLEIASKADIRCCSPSVWQFLMQRPNACNQSLLTRANEGVNVDSVLISACGHSEQVEGVLATAAFLIHFLPHSKTRVNPGYYAQELLELLRHQEQRLTIDASDGRESAPKRLEEFLDLLRVVVVATWADEDLENLEWYKDVEHELSDVANFVTVIAEKWQNHDFSTFWDQYKKQRTVRRTHLW